MCKCTVGKNIPGGWLITPCTCSESDYKYQHYLNKTRPRRMKQLAELEARLREQERIAHA
ncbi:hypothetical protein ABD70_17610 [Alkalihalobacillus lehensis]|nr:hypothetical protein [Shouchella lehensis]